MKYSVLMSVYQKENPTFFVTAIESMLNQTVKPSEMVIVCDGPLGVELEDVVYKYSFNPIFRFIKLKENVGLGKALSIGVLECKNEFILRMDSDDISLFDRAKKELEVLNSGYDIVGSYISEFVDDPNNIKGIRTVPLSHNDIIKFSKKRTPFNHPSVAFKKSAIISAGNYSPETRFIQDYFLWIRCIQNGCKCCNISEVLVNMRSGIAMRSRRKGKEYKKSYKIIFKYMLKTKYIGIIRYLVNNISFFIYSHLSTRIKEKVVYSFLRKKQKA